MKLSLKQKKGYVTMITVIIVLIAIRIYTPKIYTYINKEQFDSVTVSSIWFDTIQEKQQQYYRKEYRVPKAGIETVLKKDTIAFVSRAENRKENNEFPIFINQARPFELLSLCNGDTVLAFRIVKYRNLLGGFYSINQLSEVFGMDCKLDSMAVNIDTNNVTKIKLNSCQYTDLVRHPYINKQNANAILAYRKFKKDIKSTSELLENKILTPEQYLKIKLYLSVN